jgi:hypothetical protein
LATPQSLTVITPNTQLAGILWRKRRLRLAEAAAHRRGLDDDTFGSFRKTAKVALAHLDRAPPLSNAASWHNTTVRR